MNRRELAIARVVHGLAQVALVAGCTRDEPPPLPPQPVKPEARPPIDAAPAPAPIHHLTVWEEATLCPDNQDCMVLLEHTPIAERAVVRQSADVHALHFDDGCTWQADRITCANGTTTDHVQFVFARIDTHYLLHDGALESLTGSEDHAKRTPMRAFPGGVKQLSAGFRAGCVLAGDGTVWCWSDPAKPTQIAVPAHVADIAVIDPFELCVRTDDGAVSCTAPLAQFHDNPRFACSMTKLACGEGDIEQGEIDHAFDPLVALTRPLARIAMPEPATTLARDQTMLYLIDMGIIKLDPGDMFGACAAGATTVTCWRACTARWSVFQVTGLPAGVVLSPDQAAGHALAPDGSVWQWAPTCDAASVTATKLDLPPIAELADARCTCDPDRRPGRPRGAR